MGLGRIRPETPSHSPPQNSAEASFRNVFLRMRKKARNVFFGWGRRPLRKYSSPILSSLPNETQPQNLHAAGSSQTMKSITTPAAMAPRGGRPCMDKSSKGLKALATIPKRTCAFWPSSTAWLPPLRGYSGMHKLSDVSANVLQNSRVSALGPLSTADWNSFWGSVSLLARKL